MKKEAEPLIINTISVYLSPWVPPFALGIEISLHLWIQKREEKRVTMPGAGTIKGNR
jgi:hypothetical protein